MEGFSFLAFKDLFPVIKLSLSSGAMVCLNISGWEMMISLGFLAAARGKLAYIFTENPKMADVFADLSPLLAFSLLMNGIQPVLSGVAVGAGWQSIVAYVNIACYYLIGIPVGVVLGCLGWDVARNTYTNHCANHSHLQN
ncbi:hypothetical protein GH714_004576 [Hevea brasiliensis]|uniref:Protein DETOXIFICATION n=1 Tax=Hevea brasiliensis TaxID=3981 RepID=A0A6A6KH85_HEVBR|nr:hypothetical protein GH714_004576 [Hevea brasiliensis]